MEQLQKVLAENLNENLLRATISGKRHGDSFDKVKIRPVRIGGELLFQTAVSDGKREFHKNYTAAEIEAQMLTWMQNDYKQLQMDTTASSISTLVSKKGKATVKVKKIQQVRQQGMLEHNRKKRYLLEEGTAVPFLVDLGVMTQEGKIVRSRYDKFRQINRFLEFVADVLPALDRKRRLTIIDFGCGKSYLTFAMYYFLHEQHGYDVQMIGLDLKEDVIEHCSALAKKYGYENLQFLTGDIASYEGVDQVDVVVTLHACDTATDYALYKAVEWGAKVILSVPCCQHELNGQIKSELMQPVLKYSLIKERMASLLTDAFRANLLEEQGYQVQILEFIDMEHTPKNILIRAVRKNSRILPRQMREVNIEQGEKGSADKRLRECMQAWNAKPLLDTLFKESGK